MIYGKIFISLHISILHIPTHSYLICLYNNMIEKDDSKLECSTQVLLLALNFENRGERPVSSDIMPERLVVRSNNTAVIQDIDLATEINNDKV